MDELKLNIVDDDIIKVYAFPVLKMKHPNGHYCRQPLFPKEFRELNHVSQIVYETDGYCYNDKPETCKVICAIRSFKATELSAVVSNEKMVEVKEADMAVKEKAVYDFLVAECEKVKAELESEPIKEVKK